MTKKDSSPSPIFILKNIPTILTIIWRNTGNALRYLFYYPNFKKIGKNVLIPRNVSFGGMRNIEIGDHVFINQGCNLYGDYGIEIGNYSRLSPYVQVYSANYILDGKSTLGSLGTKGAKVTIGRNVWIGAGSVLLPGVAIGDNSVVGALSVVNKDIPANQLWAGNPARFVKNLN